MSERRRRSGGEGRGKRWLVWCGWGLVILLLGGNLVISFLHKDGDPSRNLLTPERLQTYGFWAAVDVTAIASAAGLVWSWRAWRQNERSSLRWAQWACGAGLFGAAFFAVTAFDPSLLSGPWLGLGYVLVFGAQSVLVAVFAYREHWRSIHGESRAHHARRDAPELLDAQRMPAVPAAKPETPGTAK